jgi:hypothetical protein
MRTHSLKSFILVLDFFILSHFFYSCSNNPTTKSVSYDKNTKSYGLGNLVDPEYAQKCIDNYEKVFCKHHKDTLTQGIWFSKEVIKYLDSSLMANGDIDGIRFYLGAYPEIDKPPVPGQVFNNQISIFGVATRSAEDEKHLDDWEALKDPKYNLVLNHGELCPIKCPH